MSNNDTPTPNAHRPKKLSVNVTDDLLDQVDAVVDKHGPFCRRHAVHLAALRLGLVELINNPERIHDALGLRLDHLA
jgi:hypothetical protein